MLPMKNIDNGACIYDGRHICIMSAGLDIGQPHAQREMSHNTYLKTGDPGYRGGGTYTGSNTEATIEMYENIFGPAGRDVKIDSQRHKRHQRWHLPDALKGHNQYLTDRVDGLITDATNSPFTRNILPYVYLENPDQKLKWNVYSFDEGIASRVPYEAAARVLPQSKRSFAGYTVRQGLAIAMEHNFMVSAAGRENFKNQLTQLVGSIQLTNDLDVHVALLQAPSHQRYMNERYHDQFRTTAQICREYVDLFGIMQKTPNALDHLIEDAKNTLKTWGSQAPSFLLCNGALTTQLTMTPEKTNYITNGPDGAKRLAQGPDLPSYRGLNIINTRKFSMDAGTAPRDLLRRRVRVAEYYHIPWSPEAENREYELYDQSRDTMFRLTWKQLQDYGRMHETPDDEGPMHSSDHWYTGVGSKRKAMRPPGQPPHVVDGGLLSGKDTKAKYMLHGVGGAGIQQVDEVSEGGMNFPAPLFNHSIASDENPKRVTFSMLKSPVMTIAGLPLNMVYAEDARFTEHHVQSETFGGGIFNDAYMDGNAQTDDSENNRSMRTFANLNGQSYPNLHKNLNAAAELLLKNDLLKVQLLRYCSSFRFGNPTGDETRTALMPYLYAVKHAVDAAGNVGAFNGLPSDAARKELISNGIKAYTQLSIDDQRAVDVTAGEMASAQSGIVAALTNIGYDAAPVIPGDGDAIEAVRARIAANNALAGANGSLTNLTINRYIEILKSWQAHAWGKMLLQSMISNNAPANIAEHETDTRNTLLDPLVMHCMMGVLESDGGGAIFLSFPNLINDDLTTALDINLGNSKHGVVESVVVNAMYALKRNAALARDPVLPATPNLHRPLCTRLEDENRPYSASSVEGRTWVTQQAAAMFECSDDMCDKVLSRMSDFRWEGGSEEAKDVIAYHNFLFNENIRYRPPGPGVAEALEGGEGDNAEQKMRNPILNSFLMHLYMSEFHPAASVRDRARARVGLSTAGKAQICHALSEVISENRTDMNAAGVKKLNMALQNMVAPTFSVSGGVPYTAQNGKESAIYAPGFALSDKFSTTEHDYNSLPAAYNDFKTVAVHPLSSNPEKHTEQMSTHAQRVISRELWQNAAGVNNNTEVPDIEANHASVSLTVASVVAHPWLAKCPKSFGYFSAPAGTTDNKNHAVAVYDADDLNLQSDASQAQQSCQDRGEYDTVFRHFLLVFATRFFEDARRFMDNGRGLARPVNNTGDDNYKTLVRPGRHLMHGPMLPSPVEDDGESGPRKDVVILRPNIEHEMLGIIMGRGGTQELGATFWGQTELSCYDDAQHGIWGMSYKYHERAMVTNERNLIRVFDVAFDGYNGGMDQTAVDWNDADSRRKFREATYARDRPYCGPSMLVMTLPHKAGSNTRCNWPNPIVFNGDHQNADPTPDPEKATKLPQINEHCVFSHTCLPAHCTPEQESMFQRYIRQLEMPMWASLDQSTRPAGDCCIANESTTQMLAFQGTMKIYDKAGGLVEHIQGSGHLGPSYVGAASVREGRGIQSALGAPQMIRQI